jgi:hypothetical protein
VTYQHKSASPTFHWDSLQIAQHISEGCLTHDPVRFSTPQLFLLISREREVGETLQQKFPWAAHAMAFWAQDVVMDEQQEM